MVTHRHADQQAPASRRRINLKLTVGFREVIQAFAAADECPTTSAIPGLINAGAAILADTARPDATNLVLVVKQNYAHFKDGKGVGLAAYVDLLDADLMVRASTRHALTPKARAYRIFLAIGVAKVAPPEVLDRPPPNEAAALLRVIADRMAQYDA